VESPHFSIMATSYNKHFASYNVGKTTGDSIHASCGMETIFHKLPIASPRFSFCKKNRNISFVML
jgi:hypothetical protein